MRFVRITTVALVVLIALAGWSGTVFAADPVISYEAFGRAWDRTDRPVRAEYVARPFVWGPAALTNVVQEPYVSEQGDLRQVQYFDKGRMEFTTVRDPEHFGSFSVASGAIVREMITGEIDLGGGATDSRGSAATSVAGDSEDTSGPLYSSFFNLLWSEPLPSGATITQTIARDGTTGDNPDLAKYNVTAAHLVDLPGLRHQIAAPFWDYMNSSGVIWENGDVVEGRLFEDPSQIIGLPLTEAYWARVLVDEVMRDVLIQPFERRILTFIPEWGPTWALSTANSGEHYLTWRYGVDYASLPAFNQPAPDAPTPPKPPAPSLDQLEADLRALEAQWNGDQAITVTDLNTGNVISINGDRTQYAACTIKIFIMMAIAQDIDAGKYTTADVQQYVLPAMGPSATWPARELLRIAGDGDIGKGVHRVNEIMEQLGAKKSILTHPPGYYGEEYGYLQSRGEVENLLTTDDLNAMLARIYFGDLLSPEMTAYVLWSMTIATPFLDGAFRSPLPPEAASYHKIGVIYQPLNVWNDAGIVTFNRGGEPYAYAVSYLSANNNSDYLDEYYRASQVNAMVWNTFSALPGETSAHQASLEGAASLISNCSRNEQANLRANALTDGQRGVRASFCATVGLQR